MMRLAIAIVLATAGTATAKPRMRPPDPPPAQVTCSIARPWAESLACFGTAARQRANMLGRPTPKMATTIIANAVGARVLRVSNGYDTPLAYLMVDRGRGWAIEGVLGAIDDIASVVPAAIDGKRGYKLVRLQQIPTHVDGSASTAFVRERTEIYCNGTNPSCAQAVVSCDILVHGAARETFRGEARIVNHQLEIVGDRSHAGSCAPPERVLLD